MSVFEMFLFDMLTLLRKCRQKIALISAYVFFFDKSGLDDSDLLIDPKSVNPEHFLK